MKKLSILLMLCLSIGFLNAQEKYSRAKVYFNDKPNGLADLSALGVESDHGEIKKGVYLISDFSASEILLMQQNNFRVETIINDVKAYYTSAEYQNADFKRAAAADCGGTHNSVGNLPIPNNFNLGSVAGFFTYQEFLNNLDSMAAKFPNLITIKQSISTFQTIEGRPIYWVKISDNPNQNENSEPQVFYNSVHHAREVASLSQLIFYMWYLLENYQNNDEVKYLVDNLEMYFVPCVNPDGYIYNEVQDPNGGGMWRKNRRNNGNGTFGVDLNRNYGYFWGYDDSGSSPNGNSETYRGTAGFSEPETQAIKWFCENHNFQMALNYHTYGNLLIYPWGYEASIYTPDSASFVNFAQLMTSHNNYKFGTGDQTVGYVVNGDSDDWMYGEQTSKNKIFSMTPEAGLQSEGFWPPASRIHDICRENVTQNLWMAHMALKYALVKDKSPSTISGTNFYAKYNLTSLGLQNNASFELKLHPVAGISSGIITKNYNNLNHLDEVSDSVNITLQNGLTAGSTIKYYYTWNNGEFEEQTDTFSIIYGQSSILFADEAINTSNWTGTWGLGTNYFVSAPNSFTDSPAGEYQNNQNKIFELKDTINLQNTIASKLTFNARWSIEKGWDYVQVQAKAINSNIWTPLCGKYTGNGSADQTGAENEPIYDGSQTFWVAEEMNLNDFLNQKIKIRFVLVTDGFVTDDGFYFDDFAVQSIKTNNVGIETNNLENIHLKNYPNPASEYTFLNYDLKAQNAEFIIFDSYGKIIKSENLNPEAKSQQIKLSGLSQGIYFYKINFDGKWSQAQKLVIVR